MLSRASPAFYQCGLEPVHFTVPRMSTCLSQERHTALSGLNVRAPDRLRHHQGLRGDAPAACGQRSYSAIAVRFLCGPKRPAPVAAFNPIMTNVGKCRCGRWQEFAGDGGARPAGAAKTVRDYLPARCPRSTSNVPSWPSIVVEQRQRDDLSPKSKGTTRQALFAQRVQPGSAGGALSAQ